MGKYSYSDFIELRDICIKDKNPFVFLRGLRAMEQYLNVFTYEPELSNVYRDMLSYYRKHHIKFMLFGQMQKMAFNSFIQDNIHCFEFLTPNYIYKGYTDLETPIFDTETINKLLQKFLLSLGGIYNYYLYLEESESIMHENYSCDSKYLNNNSFDTNFLFHPTKPITNIHVGSFESAKDLIGFFNQLGQAYYFQCNEIGFKESLLPQNAIKEEVASNALELLFIDFLRGEGYLEEANIMYDYFNLAAFRNYQVEKTKFEYYRRQFGVYVSLQLYEDINSCCSLEEFMLYIYKCPFDKILEDIKRRNKGEQGAYIKGFNYTIK